MIGRPPKHAFNNLEIGGKTQLSGSAKIYPHQFINQYNKKDGRKLRIIREGKKIFVERIEWKNHREKWSLKSPNILQKKILELLEFTFYLRGKRLSILTSLNHVKQASTKARNGVTPNEIKNV